MNVLNCFLDNRFGGPHRRAELIANQLKNMGILTLFLFNEKEKGMVPITTFQSYMIHNSQLLSRNKPLLCLISFLLFLPFNLRYICRIISSENISIIHVNGLQNILPALAGRLMKRKVLLHLNDASFPNQLRKIFLRLMLLFVDVLAVTSSAVEKFYFGETKLFCRKPKFKFPVPVDLNEFNPDLFIQESIKIRKEIFISSSTFLVGAVGNVNMLKGYEYLFEAIKLVKKQIPNIVLIIVGEKVTTQKKYIEKLEKFLKMNQLDDTVRFLGFRKDVPGVLSSLDLFIMSSVSESGPLTVLEAMAMKVPVIATDVGLVAEVVKNKETGFLVPIRDSDRIAKCLLEVFHASEKQLNYYKETGRKAVSELYSVDKIASLYVDVYESLK